MIRARISRGVDDCIRSSLQLLLAACLVGTSAAAPDEPKPLWQRIEDTTEVERTIPGTAEYGDEDCVVTMPSGRKYISNQEGAKVSITMPNGQRFEEMTAHMGFGRVFVNEDETLVGAVLVGCTQSGDLYIYAAGADGKFRQIPDVHDQISRALEKADAPFGPSALRLVTVKGRRFTLLALEFGPESGGYKGWLFEVEVSPDGQIALVPVEPADEVPTNYVDFLVGGVQAATPQDFEACVKQGKERGIPEQVLFETRMLRALVERDRKAVASLAPEAAGRLSKPKPDSSAFSDSEYYLANVHSLLAIAAADKGDTETSDKHLGDAIWAAPGEEAAYLRAVEPRYSQLLREDVREVENEQEVEALAAEARNNGVSDQAIFELRLVYASLNDDAELADRLAPEAAAWLQPARPAGWLQRAMQFLGLSSSEPAKKWSAEQSGLNSEQQFLAFVHHVLSLAAMKRGEDETAKLHLAQAIRNEPQNAEDFCAALVARRDAEQKMAEEERVSKLRLDLDREISDSDGKKTTLRTLLGTNKALLLDFWASWCGPCIAGMPSLKEKAKALAPQGIIVVAMNTENDAAKAEAQRKEHGMENVPWMLDPEETSYSELLGVDSIPRMVLVDPEGKIHFNGHPMDEELATALQKIDPAIALPRHDEG